MLVQSWLQLQSVLTNRTARDREGPQPLEEGPSVNQMRARERQAITQTSVSAVEPPPPTTINRAFGLVLSELIDS